MKKTNIVKAITACMLALIIVLIAIPSGVRIKADEKVDTSAEAEQKLEDKRDAIKSQKADLQKKLEAAKANEAEQEKLKEYLDSTVRLTQEEIVTTEELIKEYDLKIEAKSNEIKELEVKIENKFEIMKERLRFTYMQGKASYLEMVLEADSFTDALMTIERVGRMIEFDRGLMIELEESLEKLESDRVTLEEAQEKQKAEKEALVTKKADLEKQIEDTLAYIKKLEADQVAIQAEYEKAKAAEEQADRDIAALLAQRAKEQAQNKPGSYKPIYGGKLIWPVPGYSRISSPFGPRTLWGRYDYHLGIDIPAPSGTPIKAAAAGQVVISTYHYSYGYYCLIDHGSGYSTLYAHNRRLLVKAGDIVTQGQQIAEMGTTGSSSGNHLHFEVRINGQVQNPSLYVAP